MQKYITKPDRRQLAASLGLTDAQVPNPLGWLGLYSDMSKVGNVNLPGRQIDKHDEISG